MRRIAFTVVAVAPLAIAGLGLDGLFIRPAAAQQSEPSEGERSRAERPNGESEGNGGKASPRRESDSDSRRSSDSARGKPAAGNDAADAADGAAGNRKQPAASNNPGYVRTRDPIEERLQTQTKSTEVELHPLAAANPNHNVIVCVAGCPKGRDSVVHFAPRAETQPTQPVALIAAVDTSAPVAAAPSINAIVCVAGCYGSTPKSYPAAPVRAASDLNQASLTGPGTRAPAIQAANERTVGRWLTTVATADEGARRSKPRAVTTVPGRSRKGAASEWFTSRFRRQ